MARAVNAHVLPVSDVEPLPLYDHVHVSVVLINYFSLFRSFRHTRVLFNHR